MVVVVVVVVVVLFCFVLLIKLFGVAYHENAFITMHQNYHFKWSVLVCAYNPSYSRDNIRS